jgi:hypothetical protein
MAIALLAILLAVAGYCYLTIAPGRDVVPMQWSLKGNVNWSAPRSLAFAFVPTLAAAVFVALWAAGIGEPRELIVIGAVFLAMQVLHGILLGRWFRALKS